LPLNRMSLVVPRDLDGPPLLQAGERHIRCGGGRGGSQPIEGHEMMGRTDGGRGGHVNSRHETYRPRNRRPAWNH
jgi:hypothetical protein